MFRYVRAEEDVGGSNENLIVATHTGQLMIYKDTQLIWAASITSLPPIAVRVAQYGNLAGLITTLDDSGKLSILYLGTDPPSNSVGNSSHAKDLNYESMDEEHRRLLTVIRESQSDSRQEPKEKIILRAQVPTSTDGYDDEDRNRNTYEEGGDTTLAIGDNGRRIETTVRLYVTSTGTEPISNVSVNLDVPAAFHVRETSIKLASIGMCQDSYRL